MKDAIDISIVLDRSGSMSSIKKDIIGGLNEFIKKQKEVSGEGTISLFIFDSEYDIIFENKDIKTIRFLTEDDLVPRGSTALYDAIGRTIDRVGARLRNIKEEDRPNKVVVMIASDGAENSSVEYVDSFPKFAFSIKSPAKIANMIKHQTDKYDWQFLFLGTNQDALLTGKDLGIGIDNSITFNCNRQSINQLFAATSEKVSAYRCSSNSDSLKYNQEDRKEINV